MDPTASGVPVMAPGLGDRARAGRLATGPAVRFGEGRRPESALQVQVAEFEGPLALLLALIEARQLDVLTVPLGRTGRGLSRCARHARCRPAGQRQLVRGRGEPADPHQEPRDAAAPGRPRPDGPAGRGDGPRGRAAGPTPAVPRPPRCRARGWPRRRSGGSVCSGASRAPPHAAAIAGARPGDGPTLDPARLVARAGAPRGHRTARRAAAGDPGPDDHHHRAGRDHPRRPALAPRRSCSRTCSRGVRDRVVIAITFLAMLELMKRREIVVEQAAPWGPIVARVTSPPERAAAGVAERVDDEPLDETLESFA